jgi:hypothetical protein
LTIAVASDVVKKVIPFPSPGDTAMDFPLVEFLDEPACDAKLGSGLVCRRMPPSCCSSAWWQAWHLDPWIVLPIGLAVLCYLRGLRRWEERSRR